MEPLHLWSILIPGSAYSHHNRKLRNHRSEFLDGLHHSNISAFCMFIAYTNLRLIQSIQEQEYLSGKHHLIQQVMNVLIGCGDATIYLRHNKIEQIMMH